MDELLKIMTEGEVIETFPFEDEEVPPGHFEAIVVYDELVYHILLSPDQQPIKINHIASDADYDFPEYEDDWDDIWDATLSDGLEDESWEEENE